MTVDYKKGKRVDRFGSFEIRGQGGQGPSIYHVFDWPKEKWLASFRWLVDAYDYAITMHKSHDTGVQDDH